MPTFTIDISAQAVAKLNAVVNRYNANSGTTFTLKQWLLLHIKDVAIADDLNVATTQLQEQHQRDAQAALQAALTTERDRLLTEL